MDTTLTTECETSLNSVFIKWKPKIALKAVLGRKSKDIGDGIGCVSFGNLTCSNLYTVGLLDSEGHTITKMQVKTKPSIITGEHCMRNFIHPSLHPNDIQWVHDVDDEYLWSFRELLENKNYIRRLFREACFILPNARHLVLPNPRKRYCIDLSKNVKWGRDKIMRKSRLSKYRITMNRHFRKSVIAVRNAHSYKYGAESVWLEDDLCDFLEEDHRHCDPVTQIQHHTFELWEGNELLAVCVGYTAGAMWHDYTHAAIVRDDRRAGTILTKAVGHLLTQCGIKLWYWGICGKTTSYMSDYNSYGGSEFPREQFVPLWHDALEATPKYSPQEALDAGLSLVQQADADYFNVDVSTSVPEQSTPP